MSKDGFEVVPVKGSRKGAGAAGSDQSESGGETDSEDEYDMLDAQVITHACRSATRMHCDDIAGFLHTATTIWQFCPHHSMCVRKSMHPGTHRKACQGQRSFGYLHESLLPKHPA